MTNIELLYGYIYYYEYGKCSLFFFYQKLTTVLFMSFIMPCQVIVRPYNVYLATITADS